MTNYNSERSHLRQEIRAKRRNLGEEAQAQAAKLLFASLENHPAFIDQKKLAFYIAFDGEISLHLLIEKAHQLGKQCYLPVLPEEVGELIFAEYKPQTQLYSNDYTLNEPDKSQENTISPKDLDTVFMPLVAFNSHGGRLGMGKGYYDRTFEFLKNADHNSPRLIGVAHECQRVESLQAASWDVPLDEIVTDQAIYKVS